MARTEQQQETLSAEERAALKEHVAELRASKRRGGTSAEKAAAAAADVDARIAELPDGDRALAQRVHAIVLAAAPDLQPRTWYGMPAYAKDGKVVCFFQSAGKFGTRYSTFGFNDPALLDDGRMWPISFALLSIGAAEEARITELVRRAVG